MPGRRRGTGRVRAGAAAGPTGKGAAAIGFRRQRHRRALIVGSHAFVGASNPLLCGLHLPVPSDPDRDRVALHQRGRHLRTDKITLLSDAGSGARQIGAEGLMGGRIVGTHIVVEFNPTYHRLGGRIQVALIPSPGPVSIASSAGRRIRLNELPIGLQLGWIHRHDEWIVRQVVRQV